MIALEFAIHLQLIQVHFQTQYCSILITKCSGPSLSESVLSIVLGWRKSSFGFFCTMALVAFSGL